MSKTISALKQVSQTRRRHVGTIAGGHDTAVRPSLGYDQPKSDTLAAQGVRPKTSWRFVPVLFGAMLLTVIGCFLMSLTALSEVQRVKNASLVAEKDLASHDEKLVNLKKSIEDVRLKGESRVGNISAKLDMVNTSVQKDKVKIDDLSEADSALRSSINDLKASIQGLDEKNARLGVQLYNLKKTIEKSAP